MFWEEELMIECVNTLKPKGDVLEIGFGSGFSANEIQGLAPKSHTIIESHKDVASRAQIWAKKFKGTSVIEGTWQEKLSHLGKFDQIFIDDYPLEVHSNIVASPELPHNEMDRSEEQALRKQVDTLANMSMMKISKDDIELMLNQAEVMNEEYLLTFLYEMRKKNVFNEADLSYALTKGAELGRVSQKAVNNFKKEQLEGHNYTRLFAFVNECLKNHLNPGGKIVTYFDDPSYKAEHPEQFNFSGAQLTEKIIKVQSPEHCLYFPKKEAMIIQVQKAA